MSAELDALVFGGTFDPPHAGHLSIAAQARELTAARAVWYVPASVPALRDPPVAGAGDRMLMLRAALTGQEWARVLDLEVRRGGISYSADTMDALHRDHPGSQLALLLGADAARGIGSWHRSADLLAGERFVIVNRSGVAAIDEAGARALGYVDARTTLLSVDSPRVSASEVRRRCRRGEPIDGMVPAPVARIIDERGLYRAPPQRHGTGRRHA